MTKNFQKVLELSELLNKFRLVKRGVLVNGENRWENDVEHCYMLAMMADYIISLENLSLDRYKVLRYALLHDIIETYAGDTYAYSKDAAHVASRKERESAAYEKIVAEFPEYTPMLEVVKGYEDKIDDEARFVYALDKVHPTINSYLDNGRSWHKKGISLVDLLAYKGEKVKVSPVIEKYWKELLEILERNKSSLFPL